MIRLLEPGDIAAVRTIDAAVYPMAWSEKLMQAEIDRSDRAHVVALDGDTLVGHASLLFVAPEATLTTVAVDPNHQGKLIASALLCHLFNEAILRGTTSITLEVRASNHRAQQLYERFGFVAEGVRRGYYQPEGEDAVIMWAHNIDSPEFSALLKNFALSGTPTNLGVEHV